jgi:hypothetical protein
MQSFHDIFSRPGRRHGAAVGAAVLLAVLSPVLASGPASASVASGPASASAASASMASAAAGSDRLLPGETLPAGQSIAAGHDVLTMQGNGNLVLIAPGNTPVWTSHTAGNAGASLVMQPGGNLVIAAPGGQALWSAGTAQHPGSTLVLQPNGNAVVTAPASTPTASTPPGSPVVTSTALWSTDTYRQTYADMQLAAHGWGASRARQFGCLDSIWTRESKWSEVAGNPASAYGIPQASPGSKMAAAGPDWLTSPRTQIRWGEGYIQGQYGTPCQAWAHWQVHKNY